MKGDETHGAGRNLLQGKRMQHHDGRDCSDVSDGA